MGRNVRIAKELVRIAKSLVAGQEDFQKICEMIRNAGGRFTAFKMCFKGETGLTLCFSLHLKNNNGEEDKRIKFMLNDGNKPEMDNALKQFFSSMFGTAFISFFIPDRCGGFPMDMTVTIDILKFLESVQADGDFIARIKDFLDNYDTSFKSVDESDKEEFADMLENHIRGKNFNGIPVEGISTEDKRELLMRDYCSNGLLKRQPL